MQLNTDAVRMITKKMLYGFKFFFKRKLLVVMDKIAKRQKDMLNGTPITIPLGLNIIVPRDKSKSLCCLPHIHILYFSLAKSLTLPILFSTIFHRQLCSFFFQPTVSNWMNEFTSPFKGRVKQTSPPPDVFVRCLLIILNIRLSL